MFSGEKFGTKTDLGSKLDLKWCVAIYRLSLSLLVWIFTYFATGIFKCLISECCPRPCWECYIIDVSTEIPFWKRQFLSVPHKKFEISKYTWPQWSQIRNQSLGLWCPFYLWRTWNWPLRKGACPSSQECQLQIWDLDQVCWARIFPLHQSTVEVHPWECIWKQEREQVDVS